MKVDTQHRDYTAYSPVWSKIRDVVEGQERVHAKGVKYLPKLPNQTSDEHKEYVDRTPFFNATQRTVDALTGLVFRKDPKLEAGDKVKSYSEDITMTGKTLDSLAEDVVEELLTVTRGGLLVEYPNVSNGETVSIAQADKENRRPYLTHYKAESIINWREGRVNGKMQYTLIVFRESVEIVSVDGFEVEIEDQYRVLDLDEDNHYRQRVFVKAEKGFSLKEEVYPLKGGKYFNEIPFFFVSLKQEGAGIVKPKCIDMVNMNISHYHTTASLEHGAHFTALPTLVATGINLGDEESGNDNGDEIIVGSTQAITTSEPDAKVYYVEFQGVGLSTLQEMQKSKEEKLAQMGARMLTPEKKTAESTDTVTIRQSGENSILASIAQCVSDVLTQALNVMAEWEGVNGDIKYQITKDFIPKGMTPQMVSELIALVQGGHISQETLFNELKQGEVITSPVDYEEEQGRIEEQGPDMSMIGREDDNE